MTAALKKVANDYQDFTKTTAVYHGNTEASGLAYVTLGLSDECGELATACEGKNCDNILDEAGDVYWYAARICDHLDLKFGDVVYSDAYDRQATLTGAWEHALLNAAIIAGRVKIIHDSHLWNDDQRTKVEGIIFKALSRTLSAVNSIGRFAKAQPHEIMQRNTEKLTGRKERGVLQGDGDKR